MSVRLPRLRPRVGPGRAGGARLVPQGWCAPVDVRRYGRTRRPCGRRLGCFHSASFPALRDRGVPRSRPAEPPRHVAIDSLHAARTGGDYAADAGRRRCRDAEGGAGSRLLIKACASEEATKRAQRRCEVRGPAVALRTLPPLRGPSVPCPSRMETGPAGVGGHAGSTGRHNIVQNFDASAGALDGWAVPLGLKEHLRTLTRRHAIPFKRRMRAASSAICL